MPSVTPPQELKTTTGVPPADASPMVRLVPDVRHGPNGRTSLDGRMSNDRFLPIFYARNRLIWTLNHASYSRNYEHCSLLGALPLGISPARFLVCPVTLVHVGEVRLIHV